MNRLVSINWQWNYSVAPQPEYKRRTRMGRSSRPKNKIQQPSLLTLGADRFIWDLSSPKSGCSLFTGVTCNVDKPTRLCQHWPDFPHFSQLLCNSSMWNHFSFFFFFVRHKEKACFDLMQFRHQLTFSFFCFFCTKVLGAAERVLCWGWWLVSQFLPRSQPHQAPTRAFYSNSSPPGRRKEQRRFQVVVLIRPTANKELLISGALLLNALPQVRRALL